ncbi:MAG: MoaD/ThiS family protein [Desulfobacterales bacterium]|nr:MoaD/ThiS family protein [Desulfobacterales bacterium]
MKIEIHLFASLAKYLPAGSLDKTVVMEISHGTSIMDVISRIEIPREDVKLIFLNGIHARDAETLKDGDRLGLFPPIGGG